MPRFFFPFAWGSPSLDTVAQPIIPLPFWVKDTPGALAWSASKPDILPRFQHLYPDESTIGWTKKEPV